MQVTLHRFDLGFFASLIEFALTRDDGACVYVRVCTCAHKNHVTDLDFVRMTTTY